MGRLLLHRADLQRETRYVYNEAGQIRFRIDANWHLLAYRCDRIGVA